MPKQTKDQQKNPRPSNWPTGLPYDRAHSYLTCANNSIQVGAVLLYGAAIASKRNPTSIGYLSQDKLWSLFLTGYNSGCLDYPKDIPRHILDQLSTGEELAITLGLTCNQQELPNGSCLGEILASAGVNLLPANAKSSICN